jgi:hypothetical protein
MKILRWKSLESLVFARKLFSVTLARLLEILLEDLKLRLVLKALALERVLFIVLGSTLPLCGDVTGVAGVLGVVGALTGNTQVPGSWKISPAPLAAKTGEPL